MSTDSEAMAHALSGRIEELATISESAEHLTRRFATPEHRQANDLVAGWMKDAGLAVYEDTIGNIVGRYEGREEGLPALMLGSHLDTVVNAGKFDGMLGVVCGLAAVEHFSRQNKRLPFALEVVGFADEEGVRYHSTYLGSKAITGKLKSSELDRLDKDGISMRDALVAFGKNPDDLAGAARQAREISGFLEVHIEQGPVLERENLAVGVVTSIAGATRLSVNLYGKAGHAGTVPMTLRQDALCAAAEAVSAIERICRENAQLVGTVGQLTVSPGASNVIPGNVQFTVDVRSDSDKVRHQAVSDIKQSIINAASERDVEASIDQPHAENSIDCDSNLLAQLETAITSGGHTVQRIASGAGHDTAAMLEMVPAAMLFVRCRDGLSHHPDESILPQDAVVAVDVLIKTLEQMADH